MQLDLPMSPNSGFPEPRPFQQTAPEALRAAFGRTPLPDGDAPDLLPRTCSTLFFNDNHKCISSTWHGSCY